MQDSRDSNADTTPQRTTLQYGQSGRVGASAGTLSQQVSVLTAPRIDLTLPKTFRRSAFITTTLLLVISALEVIAWALDIHALKHPTEEVALQSAAALNFLLISCAVITYYIGASKLPFRIVSKLMALVVLIGAGAAYVEHTFHLYWENLVLWQPADAFGLTYPGPLLQHESLGFVCVALAILCLRRSIKRDYFPSQLLAIVVALPKFNCALHKPHGAETPLHFFWMRQTVSYHLPCFRDCLVTQYFSSFLNLVSPHHFYFQQ